MEIFYLEKRLTFVYIFYCSLGNKGIHLSDLLSNTIIILFKNNSVKFKY